MTANASLADHAEYLALRGAVGALRRLRWSRAGAIGEQLGALGYRPLGIRRTVAERQIAAAFPELPAAEVRRIALASFRHLGRTSIETALLPSLARTEVLAMVAQAEGWSLMERALALGRGLILVTGHLGNWEVGGAWMAARGVPLDAVVRRMSNPLFDNYLNDTRARMGVGVIHDRDAVRRTTRSLKEGRVVALLADQGVLNLASTFVPFFGRPAKTPRGPAVFALRLSVPILFGTAVRQPTGRFHLVLESVPVENTGDREADIDRIVARYTSVLERHVRLVPEQYFWQHRRWKRQPPDTPAALRDPV